MTTIKAGKMLSRINYFPSGSVAYVGTVNGRTASWNPIPWKKTRWAVEQMDYADGHWGPPAVVATFATADAANSYCHAKRAADR